MIYCACKRLLCTKNVKWFKKKEKIGIKIIIVLNYRVEIKKLILTQTRQ